MHDFVPTFSVRGFVEYVLLSNAGCKGPDDFNCDHDDLLYIFRDSPGQPLKAIYFDNEGMSSTTASRRPPTTPRFSFRTHRRQAPIFGWFTN